MKYDEFLKYTVKDFILDEDFIKWVQHPSQHSNDFWSGFLKEHPEKKQIVDDAIYFIKSIRAIEPDISRSRLEQILDRAKQADPPRNIYIGRVLKIAAIFVFLVSIGAVLYYTQRTIKPFPIEYVTEGTFEKGRIILPDGTISEFETEQTQIQQKTGELTINNDTVILTDNLNGNEENSLAHVIIPYGKRSDITLADGTRIWLNAGSQLSYPLSFTGSSREVYLAGEAFFEVESNPNMPFYVITNDLKIRVTGTRFNVTSYLNDHTTQALLLSGKIGVTRNKRFGRSIDINPGELIEYRKSDGNITLEKVDVELYSSWINGYLVFDDEPVENIFKKLERYYNRRILTDNIDERIRFTGKLDLADNMEKVLNFIAFSASFSFEIENETVIIKQKY